MDHYVIVSSILRRTAMIDFRLRVNSKGNGDGIDVFCGQNVLIDRVFMRNSDDTIALYQHRWN
jgi:polygalacturonase